jgi:hypothetical protein
MGFKMIFNKVLFTDLKGLIENPMSICYIMQAKSSSKFIKSKLKFLFDFEELDSYYFKNIV